MPFLIAQKPQTKPSRHGRGTVRKKVSIPKNNFLKYIQHERNKVVNKAIVEPTNDEIMSVREFDQRVSPFLKMYYCHPDRDQTILQQVRRDLQKTQHNINIKHDHTYNLCNCGHILHLDSYDSVYICMQCGFSKPFNYASLDTNINDIVDFSTFSYQRINHLKETLNRLQNIDCHVTLDATHIDRLLQALWADRLTTKDITLPILRKKLKQLKLSQYLGHELHIYYHITGIPPLRLPKHVEEKFHLMFISIQEPFEKVCPSTRKNFLSYPYCLYKFSQLLGLTNCLSYFKLLKSHRKLHAQEVIFKRICMELNWPFFPIVDI